MSEPGAGTGWYVVAVCDSNEIDGKHIAEVIDQLPNVAAVVVRRCEMASLQGELPEPVPDFVVLDLCSGGEGGDQIGLIKRIRDASPSTPVKTTSYSSKPFAPERRGTC